MRLSDYPPGVTGNEPQITGECGCGECDGEHPTCPDCDSVDTALNLSTDESSEWLCWDCGRYWEDFS